MVARKQIHVLKISLSQQQVEIAYSNTTISQLQRDNFMLPACEVNLRLIVIATEDRLNDDNALSPDREPKQDEHRTSTNTIDDEHELKIAHIKIGKAQRIQELHNQPGRITLEKDIETGRLHGHLKSLRLGYNGLEEGLVKLEGE